MNASNSSETRFTERLQERITHTQSLLFVGLDPNPEMLPTRYRNRENSSLLKDLREWLQFVITETAELVCAYKPTLGFYIALGAPGMELLQATIAAIPAHIPIILDAKHSDLNTSTPFAQLLFEQWQIDAVTLSAYAGQDHVAPFWCILVKRCLF